MYFTVGNNALEYEWLSAEPLYARTPLAGQYTNRCQGRDCTRFAMHVHYVRSARA